MPYDGPELERLAKEKDGVIFKIDTKELPNLTARYGIRSIPTMLLFADGREVKRVSGAMPARQIAYALGV